MDAKRKSQDELAKKWNFIGPVTSHTLVDKLANRTPDADQNEAWSRFDKNYRDWFGSCLETRIRLQHRRPHGDEVDLFISHLLEKSLVAKYDRSRARFRAYLSGVMKRWVGKEHSLNSWNHELPKEEIPAPCEGDDLVKAEESLWCRRQFERAVSELERTKPENAKIYMLFNGLRRDGERFLLGKRRPCETIAAELRMEVNLIHVRLFRARKFLLDYIESEFLRTLPAVADREEEWREFKQRLLDAGFELDLDDARGADKESDAAPES